MNRHVGGWRCAVALTVSGCGTVVNGIHQDVAITSNPGGSRVMVDGVVSGTTPLVVPLSRRAAHVIKAERDGYLPMEASIIQEYSWWEWGNIVFAGLIGMTIDAWSGGMYDLSQDRVHFQFQDGTATHTAMPVVH